VTGTELRQIRDRLRLTQAAFAARLGMTPNSLARLERGERGVSETVAILARLLAREARPSRRKGT
jgi:transcriptional regulator with XRE-family HTH domain